MFKEYKEKSVWKIIRHIALGVHPKGKILSPRVHLIYLNGLKMCEIKILRNFFRVYYSLSLVGWFQNWKCPKNETGSKTESVLRMKLAPKFEKYNDRMLDIDLKYAI